MAVTVQTEPAVHLQGGVGWEGRPSRPAAFVKTTWMSQVSVPLRLPTPSPRLPEWWTCRPC